VPQKITFIQEINSQWIAPLVRILLCLPLLGLVSSAAPDNRHRILFTGYLTQQDSDIFSLQPDGTGFQRQTQNGESDSEPSRSPDGQSFVYTCEQERQLNLCLGDLNSNIVVQLNHDDAIDLFPAWSPDGRSIVYMSEHQGHELYQMTLGSGDKPQQLTHNHAYDVSPAWSPDGQQLAFVSNRDGNYEIYRRDAAGRELRLTRNRAIDAAPAWSPDGQWILYISDQSDDQFTPGKYKSLYRMRPDGSGQVRLTERSLNVAAPAWSRDGEWIVFGAKHLDGVGRLVKNCLWLMPAAGGEPHPYPVTQDLNPSGVTW
jgi:TolB protein